MWNVIRWRCHRLLDSSPAGTTFAICLPLVLPSALCFLNLCNLRNLWTILRTALFRILIFALAAPVILAVAVLSACNSRRPETIASDPYATLPFRPAVTYDSGNVSIRNTEQEPYLNTRLRIYVGGTLYSMQVGTIRPDETVTHSLL